MELRNQEIDQKLEAWSLVSQMTAHWNASNLQDMASTWLLRVDDLAEWYHSGNPRPPTFKEDGSLDLVKDTTEPIASNTPRKILAYVAYHVHRDLLAKVRLIPTER
jgi:hypothetical protein